MSLKHGVPARAVRNRNGLTACLLAVALGVPGPAAAYVVVTSDNQVYEVPTRPEIRGDMVYFTLDGTPVSMRVYDLNVAKTNEFNHALDFGGDPMAVAREARRLPPAMPDDHRVMVSHQLQLKRVTDLAPDAPDYRLVRGEDMSRHPSFSDSPGPRQAPSRRTAWPRGDRTSFSDSPGRRPAMDETSRSRFAAEARRAYEDAEQDAATRGSPSRPAEVRARGTDSRLSALDAEIEGEQAYLRRLTSGEEAVDGLDREIDRSMEKIRRLQRRRDKMGDEAPVAAADPSGYEPPARYEPTGRFPSGSRQGRMEQDLAELRDRLSYYRRQQADMPPGSTADREILDERIGELEYRVERLERKLAKAARQ